MAKRLWTLTTLICLFSLGLYAQLSPTQLKEKAIEFYETSKYAYAIPMLLDYQKFNPEDIDVKYMIGLSYLATNRPQRAEDYLNYVAADKRAPDDIYIYLGRACQQNHKFKEAIRFYKKHLGEMRMKDPLREAVKDDIKRCVRGIKLEYVKGEADVENLEVLNTRNDEFAPIVPTNNGSYLYFSTIRPTNRGGSTNLEGQQDTMYGKPKSDIYFTKSQGTEWQVPQPIEEKYNTRQHDILHEFTRDGSGMIVSRGNNLSTESNLYFLALDPSNEEPTVSTKLKSPISSPYWDGNAFFFNDSILLFSSARKGGYGGRDLYYSILNTLSGKWTNPKNLGPQVNTEFNEDTPFLANNGRTLYFSSNNLESMGGYDVFSTVYKDSSLTWTKPVNLGFPINSAADDRYFRLANNGLRAYFSSDRPGGLGGQDLYLALFRRYITEQIEYSDPLVFFMVAPPEPVVIEPKTEVTEMSELPVGIDPNPVVIETPTPVVDPVVEKPKVFDPTEIRTYQFSPINYEPEKEIIQSATRGALDKLAALLNEYPQLNLTLHAHTDDNGPYQQNLYNGIKRSRVISNYLVEQGVDQGSITIQSSGPNYPRAKNKNATGNPNLLGQRFNNRIDLLVSNTLGTPVRVVLVDAVISPVIQDNQYENYRARIKGISYKVQVMASSNEVFDTALASYPDALVENSMIFNLNKVTVGLHKKFVTANALKMQLQANDFSEAYVVPYLDGVRLSRAYVEYYQDEFPDLKQFLVGQ